MLNALPESKEANTAFTPHLASPPRQGMSFLTFDSKIATMPQLRLGPQGGSYLALSGVNPTSCCKEPLQLHLWSENDYGKKQGRDTRGEKADSEKMTLPLKVCKMVSTASVLIPTFNLEIPFGINIPP
ncbi:hypothetical protein E5288_WYG012429 [Bos mutus]|uniref:Uncharacterized protein n=1 Tax=Bos mutus TaxID=72004 RepID=A0A6B0RRH7_9CETA|nr:hypothetical protein [Bos mutus]